MFKVKFKSFINVYTIKDLKRDLKRQKNYIIVCIYFTMLDNLISYYLQK